VSAALQRWGRLDIVVNNAGMISAADPVFESGTVAEMDLATWQAALARNLTSAFRPAMAGHCKQRFGGSPCLDPARSAGAAGDTAGEGAARRAP
jgi:NAD(P)-dependent dehydrogenase (short-subunit alcohol dehydrogenase family)